MASDVRPGGVRPGQVPAQPTPAVQHKEQAKTAQQQGQAPGKVSAQDAARIAQQAGFARAQRRTLKGIDIGDSSHAPIPIPDDDADAEVWSPERLEGAQEDLAMASAQLGETAAAAKPLVETIVASSFMPTEESVGRLQALADRPAPEPLPFGEVAADVRSLFGIELGDDAPLGHRILVAGLVVAGETGAIEVDKGKVDERKLVVGIQKVSERSNQAVSEAQKMSRGVNRELNLQRTFVFKR